MNATDFLNDIPLDTATAAHNGTSWTPERRGESERQGYAEGLANDYAQIMGMARNDSERATVEAWFPRYRQVIRKLTLERLHSQSNVVSWAIAGPSNFPAARMEKRARWAHNKLEKLLEVRALMLKRIKRDLRPEARPIMSGDSNAVERLEAKIAKAENDQVRMKACNVIVRKYRDNPEEGIKALAAAGFTSDRFASLFQPDFCGRIGFPDYALTNNNANIRRMKERLESIKRNHAQPEQQQDGENARLEDCPAENRVRLFFPGKPDVEVRQRLKGCGFRWSPTIGAWQAYRHPHTLELARKEAGIAA